MTSQNLAELTEAFGTLRKLSDALSCAIRSEADEQEITDDTGQLTIRLDARRRITSLVIGAHWRDAIRPEALGAQILILTLRPVFDHLEQVFDGLPTGAHRGPVDVAPMTWTFPSQATRDRLATEVRGLNRELMDLESQPPASAPIDDVPASFESDRERVTVCVNGTQITDIRIDTSWVATAKRQLIVEAIMTALDRAYAAVDAGETAPSTHHPATDRLTAVTTRINQLHAESNDYREGRF